MVAMFPIQLPSQAVKEMAASIVDLARGVRIQEPVDPKILRTGVLFEENYILALHRRPFLRLLFCFILSTGHYFCFFSSSFCISLFSFFLLFVLFNTILPFLPLFLLFHFPLFILLLHVFFVVFLFFVFCFLLFHLLLLYFYAFSSCFPLFLFS